MNSVHTECTTIAVLARLGLVVSLIFAYTGIPNVSEIRFVLLRFYEITTSVKVSSGIRNTVKRRNNCH